MLEIAGGTNVFADIKQQSVQASTEMLLARAPGRDHRAALRRQRSNMRTSSSELQAWNALGSVPAVRNHRVLALIGDEFVVPGPRVVGRHAQARARAASRRPSGET